MLSVVLWPFIVALPILRTDFLAANRLVVDMAWKKLFRLPNNSPSTPPSQVAAETPLQVLPIDKNQLPPAIAKVLQQYSDVFSNDLAKRKKITKTPPNMHI